jgi:SAM-dependent methyltransferase
MFYAMKDPDSKSQNTVSDQDVEHLALIRDNVRRFMRHIAARYGAGPARLLDIAPQEHEGARPYFPASVSVETLDIDPSAATTHIGDICKTNSFLSSSSFDLVVCTEVLEHTLQPFAAVAELRRLLRPGGHIFVSVPFNLRIHGPLPDCWRFTEHGLRALFCDWNVTSIETLNTPDRFLMPIHYTLIAAKPVS